jgi:hypothetical protein
MTDKFIPKIPNIYKCIICDYNTSNKKDYTKHCSTDKHEILTNTYKLGICPKSDDYVCTCGKIYKHRQSLHAHSKKCIPCNNSELTLPLPNNEIMLKLFNDNQDFKQIIIDQSKQMNEQQQTIKDLATRVGNNINNTHTNSHNKTFNLQFFLNETCKDALNINDFVSSIQLQLTDLETTGRIGYVEGISKIILQNLNGLEQYRRPIHCTDMKREIVYIKDNDEWTKEDAEKPLLTKAIKIIANENIKKISEWQHMNPDCADSDSNKNNVYLNIVSNSMSGGTRDETNKNMCKIISNVIKEIQIIK